MTGLEVPNSKPRQAYDLAGSGADYPGWEGLPKRTILVCSHPRSGSTLLGEVLHKAGGFGCPIEYFHRGFQPALERHWGATDFPSYVRAVYRHRTDSSGTLGVKLFWHDLEALWSRLHPDEAPMELNTPSGADASESYRKIHVVMAALFPNPVFIHLIRKDALRAAVSAVIATQTSVWRSIPNVDDNAPKQDPAYNFERIAGALALFNYCRKHWEGFFQCNQIVPHRVDYENLSSRFGATVHNLFAALGRPEYELSAPRMRRQADRRSEEMLLRFLGEMKTKVSSQPGS
jgi:LPS sulfotransferase NodH